jgi:hypothetical protein
MSTTEDRRLIDSLAGRMRNATFAMVVQMLGIVGVMIYNAPPWAGIRRPSAEQKMVAGPAAGRAADVGATASRTMPQANLAASILLFVFVGVIASVVLLTSFAVPGLVVDFNRRRILAGTWSLKKRTGDDSLFTDEVLQHDTGKLAFGYVLQLGIKMCITGFATFFAVIPYRLLGGSPLVLIAMILFIVATIGPFPTPAHVASWLDRQRELLAQERQDALSTLHDAQLQVRQSSSEKQQAGKGLQEPTNRTHHADRWSRAEDEACGWLTEDAGANGPDRVRESPRPEE